MGVANYVKDCSEKNIPGSDHKLFVSPKPNIAGITTDVDGFVTAITMETDKKFAYWEADFDSVVYNATGEASTGFFSEQHLIAKFTRKTKALQDVVDEARAATGCGLVIIRRDGTGRYWISGIAPAAKMGANRPYHKLDTNFTSGENIQDLEDGNKYTLDFSRISGTEEYELEGGPTSIGLSIEDGTAAFIEWPS